MIAAAARQLVAGNKWITKEAEHGETECGVACKE